MLFAVVVAAIVSQGQAAGKPESFSSPDPKQRIAAIQTVLREPAHESRGPWLFDALSDPDRTVLYQAIKAWRSYEDGFCEELSDAIEEAKLDGKKLTEPASSEEQWKMKLAGKLAEIAKTEKNENGLYALQTLAFFTGYGARLDNPHRSPLQTEVDNPSPYERALMALEPALAYRLFETNSPLDTQNLIESLRNRMPPSADSYFLKFTRRSEGVWQRLGIVGFSFRSKEVREKYIRPFLSSQDRLTVQCAVQHIRFEQEDWERLALDKTNWPVLGNVLVVGGAAGVDWPKEFMLFLFRHTDPLFQAQAITRLNDWNDSPEILQAVKQLYRSNAPEIRAACLFALSNLEPDELSGVITAGFADRSPIVREMALECSLGYPGFDKERIEAVAEGLGGLWNLEVDFTSQENGTLLSECLQSKNSLKRYLAARFLIENQPEIALPILKNLVRDNAAGLRTRSLATLAFTGGKHALKALLDLCGENHPDVFVEAVNYLDLGYRDEVIPLLRRFASHANRKVRVAAKRRIASLNNPSS